MVTKRRIGELETNAFVDLQIGTQLSASFYKDIHTMRLNLTGVYTTFVLTPSGSTPARIVGVQAHPNDSANAYSMSYGIFSLGAPGGAVLNGNAGYFTGVINGGTTRTASLNTDTTKLYIATGSICYLTSTNHTGNMAVEIFYRTQVS